MRWVALIAILALVFLVFWGGWFYFRDSPGTSELILDKDEVRQDTREAVEEGRQLLDRASEEVGRLGDSVDDNASKEVEHDESPR